MGADKAVRPAGTPKIGSARRVIGKQLLKLRERSGESQIVETRTPVGRDEPKTNTIFGNGSFRPETFRRIRPQTADKPAKWLP